MKKRFWTATFLLSLMLGCGRANDVTGPVAYEPSPPAPTWRDDRADLLNWFLGHRPEGAEALQAASPYRSPSGGVGLGQLSISWEGSQGSGRARYAKGPQAFLSWELYRWDATHVYLAEDHGRDGSIYAFTQGPWFARRAKLGDRGRASGNSLQWFKEDCTISKTQRFEFEWVFTAQGRMDFGGVVGVQDYVVISYVYGAGLEERYFYTWDWGWVRHQFVHNGEMRHDYSINTPGSPVDYGEECKP